MNCVRRASTLIAAVVLSIGAVSAAPANAAADTSWGGYGGFAAHGTSSTS